MINIQVTNNEDKIIEDMNTIVETYINSVDTIINIISDCKYKLVNICNEYTEDLYDIHNKLLELTTIQNNISIVESELENLQEEYNTIEKLVTKVEKIIGYY